MRADRAIFLAACVTAALALSSGGEVRAAGADFPYYRAAQRAAEAGDCAAVLANLRAFLEANPHVRQPQHRIFYLRVQRVMGECDGTIAIRGIGEDAGRLSPLPATPPAAE